jgi:hypothetical protein
VAEEGARNKKTAGFGGFGGGAFTVLSALMFGYMTTL